MVTKMIEKASWVGGVISGITILLMTGLILLEILLRSTTGISTLICEEYAAYLFLVFGSMALAYTSKSGGHIRVDLILSKLSPRARLIVDLICTAISFFVVVYLVVQSWGNWHGSFSSGQTSMYYSKPPVWMPQAFIVLGTGLFALQILSRLAALFRELGAPGAAERALEKKSP